MFNIGSGELILVALAALLLIPPKKLPQVATTLGRWLGQLQRAFQEVKSSMEQSLRDDNRKQEGKVIKNDDPKK